MVAVLSLGCPRQPRTMILVLLLKKSLNIYFNSIIHEQIKKKSTFSSSMVGVLFPSSMPESEEVVLVDASLSDLSDSRTSPSRSSISSGSFLGRLCRGRATGTAMVEPGCSSDGVPGWFCFLGKGVGAVGVEGLGGSGGWSPSKLV